MKSERLLSALLLLQAQGRMVERELAERLEVSQRTAHRDMEALCAAGIPLLAHRGVHGGWELEKGWRTRVPGLDDAELWGLLMAQPSAPADRRISAAASRAFEKLLAAMPAGMKTQAEFIRARLHIDPAGWRPVVEDLTMLPVVQDAVMRDAKLTFAYTRADGQASLRTVDPLGLVSKQATWYLVARSAEGIRTYRISRIKNAVALAVQFERPKNFNLAKAWARSTQELSRSKQRFEARLALSPEGVAALAQWASLQEIAQPEPLWEGWKAFAVEFDSGYAAQFVALGLGSKALVLGPEELRGNVAKEMTRMAARARRQSAR
ncbi:MAG TPA: WYL domain-containing protein [Acidobacteriaceae bacterium]|nr:WYL domain-containing protein [Acidobacteriaceae bacterium]